uniref:Odorant receptor n=1 Tax=Phthorimaea operculella TaxID=192464 RepID=A0A8K1YT58_PHTOP|nr:OR1 [Phthorimaea operculella]
MFLARFVGKEPFHATSNVLTFNYVKWLRMFIMPIGIWPGEEFGEKMSLFVRCHRYYYIIQGVILLAAQYYFIEKYFDTMTFFLKGYNYLVFLLTFLTWARICTTTQNSYGTVVKTFINTLHLAHRKLNNGYERLVFNIVEMVSFVFCASIVIISSTAFCLFSAAPMVVNYRNGFFTEGVIPNATYNCIVCFTIPKIIDTHDFSVVGTLYTVWLGFACTTAVCGMDILVALMALQLIANILVLRNRLDTLTATKLTDDKETSEETYVDAQTTSVVAFNKEENKIIHDKLVDCIEHHKMISMFTDMMSSFFGPVLGINYGFHLIACCLLLLECGGGTDALFRFGPMTLIIFGQLVLLSVVFEIVATVSEKLPNSVYATPWYRMDAKNRRTVFIMLMRSQRTISITALGMTNVGVTTMAQILKATASYYALLTSINNN